MRKRRAYGHVWPRGFAWLLVMAMSLLISSCLIGCQDVTQTRSASSARSIAVSSAPPSAEQVDCSALEANVRDIVAAYEREGEHVSVAFEFVGAKDGGFQIAGDVPMASASTIKLAILAALFEEIDAGTVSLDQTLVADSHDVVAGTGVGIRIGEELTVRELSKLMIAESDNTASNVLLSLISIDTVNEFASDLGLAQTNLDHRLMTPDPARDNLTSANDLVTLLALIAEGDLVSPELSQLAQEFLLAQSDRDALAAGLSNGINLGNKTGSLTYARNDAGILYDVDGTPLAVIAVMTNDMGEYEANKMMADISTTVCEELARER